MFSKFLTLSVVLSFFSLPLSLLFAQPADSSVQPIPDKDAIKLNLSADGKRYIQLTLLNQTWVRWNESNTGTTFMSTPKDYTFDIGLRRTRMQVLAQVTDRVFLYFQFGQNNFNRAFAVGANRKAAAFFHDAVCEYRISKHNELKIGGGLTIANGLSRFSQPSIGTIMTMDVPVFLQATVDQTDEFSRKLSIYARGQIWKLDYRFSLSDPFPVSSNGNAAPALGSNANFALKGHSLQTQGYLMYQFFEHEAHTTPYQTGTHLGKKKVFNIGAGAIYQPKAMWRLNAPNDTVYQKMLLFGVESFLDLPINKEEETAISAHVGYYNYNFGTNYMRYNGIMNPANGSTASNLITGQGATYGNAYPMFGSGQSLYAQFGYVLPKSWLKTSQLLPYASLQASKWDRLEGKWMVVANAGVNWLIKGHKSKISLNYQNRPSYLLDSNNKVQTDKRRSEVVLQYQIFF